MFVCILIKGYDKAEVDRLLAEGKLVKEKSERLSISQSVSSLDRDDDSSDTFKQVCVLIFNQYIAGFSIVLRPVVKSVGYLAFFAKQWH